VLARLAGLKQEQLNEKLHMAVRNASTKVIALCVEAGAQLEWHDSQGVYTYISSCMNKPSIGAAVGT